MIFKIHFLWTKYQQQWHNWGVALSEIAPPSRKNLLFLKRYKNKISLFVETLFNFSLAVEKLYYLLTLLRMSIEAAKTICIIWIIQNKLLFNRNVNHVCLILSCSCSSFQEKNGTFCQMWNKSVFPSICQSLRKCSKTRPMGESLGYWYPYFLRVPYFPSDSCSAVFYYMTNT